MATRSAARSVLAMGPSAPYRSSFQGSQALRWPCRVRTPKTIVLFIPGNPGLADYYIPFLSTIHSCAPEQLEILAVSHRGHAPVDPVTAEEDNGLFGRERLSEWDDGVGAGSRQDLSLQAQIDAKVQLVDEIRKTYPRRRQQPGAANASVPSPSSFSSSNAATVIKNEGRGISLRRSYKDLSSVAAYETCRSGGNLNGDAAPIASDDADSPTSSDVKLLLIGHSVGAYICTKVLDARPDDVDGVHALFPTVSHIARSPNGLRLRPLFHPITPTLLHPILLVLSLIPFTVLNFLTRLLTLQPSHSARTTSTFLSSPSHVSASLQMAREEMETIKGLDEAFVRDVRRGGKVRWYWAEGERDGWVPGWVREEVRRVVLETDNGEQRMSSHKGHKYYLDSLTREQAQVEVLATAKTEGAQADEQPRGANCLPHALFGPEKERVTAVEANGRAVVCEKGMSHAFCIDHSEAMGSICFEWIKEDFLSPLSS